MKRRINVVLFLSVIIMSPIISYAGAYEWGGLGPRACGMGGAFTAVSDDWTSPYWNPAGLSQTVGTGIGIEYMHPWMKITDGNSIANPDPEDINIYHGDVFVRIYPSEPENFQEKDITGSFNQPFIGGFTDISGFKLSAGFYIPVGNWVDWDDTVLDGTLAIIEATFYTNMYLMVGNLAAAKEVVPGLSFGIGFNILYLKNKYRATKTYTATVMPYDYDFLREMAGSGRGFELTGGLLFKPVSFLSIGAVYRTGSKINMSGSARFSHTMQPPAEVSDYTQEFFHPSTYGLGIAFRFIPGLIISADWHGTNWSSWKTIIDFETEGVGLSDVDIDWDWKNSNRYRFGLEYRLNDIFALRTGAYYDQSPAPDEQVNLTGINDVDRKALTFGMGYKLGILQFNILYEYQWGYRVIDNVNYEHRVQALTFALFRQF